jgi:hypothetical protein
MGEVTPKQSGNQFGYVCPECGNGSQLIVEATVPVTLHQYGTEPVGRAEWTPDSQAHCACGWEGLVDELGERE